MRNGLALLAVGGILALTSPAMAQIDADDVADDSEQDLEESNPKTERIAGGVIGLGFSVASLTAAIYATVRTATLETSAIEAYKAGVPSDISICDAANDNRVIDGAASPEEVREVCEEAASLEPLQAIMYPFAAGVGAMGAWLLITGLMMEEPPPVAVYVDQTTAFATLQFEF